MNLLDILNKLTPLITDLTPLVSSAIRTIAEQSGKPADQVIAETLTELDVNEAKLLADIVKEQEAIDGGAN